MGQAFDDVHAVYCYLGSGIILSGVRLRWKRVRKSEGKIVCF